MKKICLVIGLIASIFIFAACGTPGSQTFVKNYVDGIKKGDFTSNSTLVKIQKNAMGSAASEEDKNAQKEFVRLIFTAFDYTIVSAKENGDNSSIELKVKSPDIMDILKLYQDKVTEYKAAGKDINESANALAALTEVYADKNLKKTEKALSVKLVKKSGAWTISDENALLDSLSGGYISKILGNEIPN